jgi:hypothetical protein
MTERRLVLLLSLTMVLGGACERDSGSADRSASGGTEGNPVRSLTVEEIIQNPELVEKRLRATNPDYRGGAHLTVDPELGLVGEIAVRTVRDLSGLRGIPFGALDLRGLLVTDLEPLRGMPLKALGLESTRVRSLEPLRGMALEKLYLNDTAVSDLSPLAGMPLRELMLVRTRVEDLAPLRDAPLEFLWVNETQVRELSSIAACPLVSLTLEGSRVSDLSPLSGHETLERLHIGNTPVTDLTTLAGLQLVRLIFTPERIMSGLDVARQMASLQEIGTTLDGRMPPAQFWQECDARSSP